MNEVIKYVRVLTGEVVTDIIIIPYTRELRLTYILVIHVQYGVSVT